MKTPFLDFHNNCIKDRKLPPPRISFTNKERRCYGLCEAFENLSKKHFKIFNMFDPGDGYPLYWGSGERSRRYGEYTDFRETIVLFCAVINGEL
jgi:hypothetical protein